MPTGFDYDNILAQLGLTASQTTRQYDEIYRTPSRKPASPQTQLADSRTAAKLQFIEDQHKQQLQYAARFAEIKKQVEAEMLAKRSQEQTLLRQHRLVETHGVLNEQLIKVLHEQTEKEIQAARGRELDAKASLLAVQIKLKRSIRAFSAFRARHVQISTAVQKLLHVKAQWQKTVCVYLWSMAVQKRREAELQQKRELRRMLAENKCKQADDIYQFRLRQKLYRLICELARYSSYEKEAKRAREERLARINAFVERIETHSPEKPAENVYDTTKPKESSKVTHFTHNAAKSKEKPQAAVTAAISAEVQPERQSSAKQYKPYVAPPKPRFLMQMDERAKLRQQQLQKRKSDMIQNTVKKDEQQAETRKENARKADNYNRLHYLQKIAFAAFVQRIRAFSSRYNRIAARHTQSLIKQTFGTLVLQLAQTRKREADCECAMRPLLARIKNQAYQRLVISLLLANVRRYHSIAQTIMEHHHAKTAKTAFQQVQAAARLAAAQEDRRVEFLARKLNISRVFRQLRFNVNCERINRRIEHRAAQIVEEAELDAESLNQMLDSVFDAVWTTSAPKCRAFCEVIQGVGTEFLSAAHAFLTE